MPRNKITIFESKLRNTISVNLRDLLKRSSMTQRSLADKAGMPYTTVSGYFNAKSTPNPGAVQKLADALGVSKSAIDPRFESQLPNGASQVKVAELVNVPVLGDIACGEPITAEQNIESYMPTEKADLQLGNNFWLVCKGQSMEPTIKNGSLVLIHEQPNVEDGEVAAVLIDDEATLKRIKRISDQVLLMPDNTDYQPILLDGSENARILGKATEVKFRL